MPFEKGQSGNPATQFGPNNNANPEGRPVGSRNRSTLLRKWLDTPFKVKDPTTGALIEGTLEDAMMLGQINAAIQGGPQFKEILDSVYGKQTDKMEVSAPKKTIIRIGGKPKPTPDADSTRGNDGD